MTWLIPVIVGTLARQSAFGDFGSIVEDPSERIYLPSTQTDYAGIIEGNPDYFLATSPLMRNFAISIYGTSSGEVGSGFSYRMDRWSAGAGSIYDSSGNYIVAGIGYESKELKADFSFYIKDTAKAMVRVMWKAFEQASINLLAGNIISRQAAISISFEPTSLTFFHMGFGYMESHPHVFSIVEFPILKNFVFLRGSFQQNLSTMERKINFGASLRLDNLSIDYVLYPSTRYNLDLQYHFRIF